MSIKYPYTEQAREFCKAIKSLAKNEEALSNFESYLSVHFDTWLEKWASTPEDITRELNDFANIYTFIDIL